MNKKSSWQLVVGVGLVVMGGGVLLERLGLVDVNLGQVLPVLWPVLLIIAGLLVVFRKSQMGWLLVIGALIIFLEVVKFR